MLGQSWTVAHEYQKKKKKKKKKKKNVWTIVDRGP